MAGARSCSAAIGESTDLLALLRARLAALAGDAARATRHLADVREDPQTSSSHDVLRDDPAFEPHGEAVQLPTWFKQGRRAPR